MVKKNSNNIKIVSSGSKIASLKDRANLKTKQNKKKVRFYYSFLTIILLICLVQIGFSAILNISKAIVYQSKMLTIRQLRDGAEAKNKQLKYELSNFSKTSNLEAMARNNLKMATEDEVLVIISKEKEYKEKTDTQKYINFKRNKHGE